MAGLKPGWKQYKSYDPSSSYYVDPQGRGVSYQHTYPNTVPLLSKQGLQQYIQSPLRRLAGKPTLHDRGYYPANLRRPGINPALFAISPQNVRTASAPAMVGGMGGPSAGGIGSPSLMPEADGSPAMGDPQHPALAQPPMHDPYPPSSVERSIASQGLQLQGLLRRQAAMQPTSFGTVQPMPQQIALRSFAAAHGLPMNPGVPLEQQSFARGQGVSPLGLQTGIVQGGGPLYGQTQGDGGQPTVQYGLRRQLGTPGANITPYPNDPNVIGGGQTMIGSLPGGAQVMDINGQRVVMGPMAMDRYRTNLMSDVEGVGGSPVSALREAQRTSTANAPGGYNSKQPGNYQNPSYVPIAQRDTPRNRAANQARYEFALRQPGKKPSDSYLREKYKIPTDQTKPTDSGYALDLASLSDFMNPEKQQQYQQVGGFEPLKATARQIVDSAIPRLSVIKEPKQRDAIIAQMEAALTRPDMQGRRGWEIDTIKKAIEDHKKSRSTASGKVGANTQKVVAASPPSMPTQNTPAKANSSWFGLDKFAPAMYPWGM